MFAILLITKYIVRAKGTRAAKISPSVSKISLKCICAIYLSNYFVTKLYQSIFYISWSTVGVGKSDRGWGDVWFVCLFVLTRGAALDRANIRKESKSLNKCHWTMYFICRNLLLPNFSVSCLRLCLYTDLHPD